MIQLFNTIFGIIFSLLEFLVTGICEIFVALAPGAKNVTYKADFTKPGQLLNKRGAGFHIGEWSNNLEESHNHMICLGGSGSKKSSSIVFNTVLQACASTLVIIDPSKEIFHKTATALEKQGKKILLLDYNNPSQSEGFNVLSKSMSYTDVYKVANTLIRNSLEGSSYDYWAQSAEGMIAFFCKYLIQYAPEEYVNLPNVLHLLRVFSYEPKKIDALMVKTNPQMLSEYKSIIVTPDKTLQSTLSTAKNALRIYEMPNVAKITSRNTFSFSQLRRENCALFICSSAADSFLYRAITATFFESLFAYILSTPPYQKNVYPLMLIMDEAATMKISLSQALALTRKNRVSIATFWQDFNQIEQIYGKYEAANIFSNSQLKVFMPSGQPLATCKMLSELLGKFTYEVEGQTKVRELLTAQEVFQLNKMLVLMANNQPMLIEAKQYFNIRRLRVLTELPIYVPEVKSELAAEVFLPIESTDEKK